MPLEKMKKTLSPPAKRWIVPLLLFYKDGFGIK